MTRKNMIH